MFYKRRPTTLFKKSSSITKLLRTSIYRKTSVNGCLYMPFRSSQCHLVSGAKSHVCSVNPTNLVLCFEALLAIWCHMFVCFLLLDLWFIIKTKVIVQKLGCEKIFHVKLYGQTLTAKYKGNQKSGDENNINTWHQEPRFIPNQKTTLQALALQTYGFAPLTRWRHDHRKGIW